MTSKRFAVLGLAALYITSQCADASYFILDGKARSITAPRSGRCGKPGCFFKRLTTPYVMTKERLAAVESCYLGRIEGQWRCTATYDGCRPPASALAVVVGENRLPYAVLKGSGKVKLPDRALLMIYPDDNVVADCGLWRCTFTYRHEDGGIDQLRLSIGSLVIGPLEDYDTAMIKMPIECPKSCYSFVYLPMIRKDNKVAVFGFNIAPKLKLTLSKVIAARVLQVPAIAVELKPQRLGLKATFTFVRKGKTLPRRTHAVFINEIDDTEMTKHAFRAQAVIRSSLFDRRTEATVSLAPAWAVLTGGPSTKRHVKVPSNEIKAVVLSYEGGRQFSTGSVEDTATEISLLGRPLVCVQIENDDKEKGQLAAKELERHIGRDVTQQTLRGLSSVMSGMATFAQQHGLATRQIVYMGNSKMVEGSDYPVGVI